MINKEKRERLTRPCGMCGKIINTYPSKLRLRKNEYCSRECYSKWRKSLTGEKARHWKGGRTINRLGYILIYLPNHPYADNKGYVKEHRLVMEKSIGRYLRTDEIIHHLDSSKDNNDISNLVITNFREHLSKYHTNRKRG